MKDGLIGIVGREFDARGAGSGSLWSLPNNAADILPLGTVPDDIRSKPWGELDFEAQDGLAQDIQVLVELGPPTTAADLVRAHHSPEAAQAVMNAVAALHDALPFTDAERRWLANGFEEAGGDRVCGAAIINKVRDMSGVIVAAGKHQPVHGAELIDRLWDWWRQAGEYAPGSGTLDAAETALRGIVTVFRGDEPSSARRS